MELYRKADADKLVQYYKPFVIGQRMDIKNTKALINDVCLEEITLGHFRVLAIGAIMMTARVKADIKGVAKQLNLSPPEDVLKSEGQ